MSEVVFSIPGKPFAWRRAKSNGKIRFTDEAMEAHAETVRAIALKHFPAPIKGPVRLEVRAIFKVPESWPKNKAAGTIWKPHCQRPDGDNIAKQIGDALNRIAWLDDSQIADSRTVKVWGDRDETLVRIEAMPGLWGEAAA